MPGRLTIEHEVPFAILGDDTIAKIERYREEGKDFVIECFIPQQEDHRNFFGKNTFIAIVRGTPNDNQQAGGDSPQVSEVGQSSDSAE